MPCLLPLALLMGNTLADSGQPLPGIAYQRLAQPDHRRRVVLALSWFQLKKRSMSNGQETLSLVLVSPSCSAGLVNVRRPRSLCGCGLRRYSAVG